MSALENYEADLELALYKEYRSAVNRFKYVVETERRLYLANDVDVKVRASQTGDVFFEVLITDAWVWDIYRTSRFITSARIVTFKDVNVEELHSVSQEKDSDSAE